MFLFPFQKSAQAQDRRNVQEPVIPATCVVLSASLNAESDVSTENLKSKLDTQRIQLLPEPEELSIGQWAHRSMIAKGPDQWSKEP